MHEDVWEIEASLGYIATWGDPVSKSFKKRKEKGRKEENRREKELLFRFPTNSSCFLFLSTVSPERRGKSPHKNPCPQAPRGPLSTLVHLRIKPLNSVHPLPSPVAQFQFLYQSCHYDAISKDSHCLKATCLMSLVQPRRMMLFPTHVQDSDLFSLFPFHVYECFLCMYECSHVCNAHIGQKRALLLWICK